MSSYAYEAMDTHGKEVKSEIDAASEADALDKIRAQNLFPTKVNLKGGKAAAAAAAACPEFRHASGGGEEEKRACGISRCPGASSPSN